MSRCKFCFRPKGSTKFIEVDVCNACYIRRDRNGSCDVCGYPLNRKRFHGTYCKRCRDSIYCLACGKLKPEQGPCDGPCNERNES